MTNHKETPAVFAALTIADAQELATVYQEEVVVWYDNNSQSLDYCRGYKFDETRFGDDVVFYIDEDGEIILA